MNPRRAAYLNGLRQVNENMKNNKQSTKLHDIINILRNAAGTNASSMRFRLYIFLFALVFLLAAGVVIIFITTGTFTTGKRDVEKFIENEFANQYSRLTEQYGDAALQLVSLSQELSRSIEFRAAEKRIPVSAIQSIPEDLEDFIGNELGRLKFALERIGGSGVFMILDATVNPALENAEHSRAGIYLRISEPKLSGAIESTWLYFRGFPRIAYYNGLYIQVKWDMEFNVENRAFFHQPIEKGRTSNLPVSKLYYWSMENIIPELDDALLVCSIPLIDSNGNMFGVCGFEISELNFKTNYFSGNSEYGDIIYIFGAMDGNKLDTDNALISGKPAAVSGINSGERFHVSEIKGLDLYNQENGKVYYGLHDEIRLYPSDSPFAEQKYALSFLIPKDTVDAKVLRGHLQLIAVCVAFLSIGIFVSLFFGKRYINPIMSAFDAIQSGNLESVRTNISEIDKLIEQIKNLRSADRPLPDDFFEDFTKRVGTLTPVEKNIFRYHIDSISEKEIMSKMFITKNAFKKHNERIYNKLGVSGKQALMLYVELIKMSGQTDKIV